MAGMDTFLDFFGNYTVNDFVQLIILAGFGIAIYYKLKSYFDNHHEREEKINNILEQYPKWHQQSLDIQKEFNETIIKLEQQQEETAKKLEDMDAGNKHREQNRIRERLLQAYRFYTNTEKNPLQAWSEMEEDSFFRLFKDYEDIGGDGYIHSVVEPAMRALHIIPQHEDEKVSELSKSRK